VRNFGSSVQGLEFRISGFEFRVEPGSTTETRSPAKRVIRGTNDSDIETGAPIVAGVYTWFRAQVSGFWVLCLRYRVEGAGLRVWG
jgi:hypothetical protein